MIYAVVMFLVGLVLLIKGGDWFVDGATGIAKRFNIPELLIGATVVSIGTTLPEVMVSATSAVKGIGAMAYGNAIGSIICNTALIAAITVAIKPSRVEKKSLMLPVAFFFGSALLYGGNAIITGYFSRTFGFVMLAIFIIYMVIIVRSALKKPTVETGVEAGVISGTDDTEAGAEAVKTGNEAKVTDVEASKTGNKTKEEERPLWQEILFLVAGAILIAAGADLLVNNGTYIATALGVPASVIALTFVALGTSLPEFATAITSLAKGHGALSLGNIIGANIINLVLVSGASMSIAPFALPAEKLIAGMNASVIVDLPVMYGVMLILTIPALIRGKLSRVQGIALLLIYFTYVVFQFTA